MHYKDTPLRGVFHSFTGSANEASALLEFPGFVLGINGVATFKKSTLPEVLREIPLTRLVVETDSPYLSPEPHRGKLNIPGRTRFVAEKLAALRGISLDEVAAATTANACRFFRLPALG